MNRVNSSLKHYATITLSYWAFTLTDGAIRMLVVLHFYQLGYSPLAIASLFLFYEIFGIITNLLGGWLASRIGLNRTMHIGMGLQILALLMLAVPSEQLTMLYVMSAQALSGIAKDLNKMSAKASIKGIVSDTPSQASSQLFKWVAILTGSKNTLKGVGYFLGGLLLSLYGFQTALMLMAGSLFIVFGFSFVSLPNNLGKTRYKPKFSQLFAHSARINWLAGARFFLFGSRDVWFVVALPVYFSSTLNWSHEQTGSFFALWIIVYGVIQSLTPQWFRQQRPSEKTLQTLAWLLGLVSLAIVGGLQFQLLPAAWVIIIGLLIYAILFAFNSAVHSYLIVAWSDGDKVAMNVGFYYMANAAGRLTGTVLSGLIFQSYGLVGCILACSLFILCSILTAKQIPSNQKL